MLILIKSRKCVKSLSQLLEKLVCNLFVTSEFTDALALHGDK